MIGEIEVEISTKSPEFPLGPVNAFKSSPQTIVLKGVPKKIDGWALTRVYFKMKYPSEVVEVECRQVGKSYVGTVKGSSEAGTVGNGFEVYADGIDENGNSIKGYILGCGDVCILDDDGRIIPQRALDVLNVVKSKDEDEKHIGDSVFTENGIDIWDGVKWRRAGGMTERDWEDILKLIPAKVSELENDAGYLVKEDVAQKADRSELSSLSS